MLCCDFGFLVDFPFELDCMKRFLGNFSRWAVFQKEFMKAASFDERSDRTVFVQLFLVFVWWRLEDGCIWYGCIGVCYLVSNKVDMFHHLNSWWYQENQRLFFCIRSLSPNHVLESLTRGIIQSSRNLGYLRF